MNIDNCHIIDLPKIGDPRGNLTFIEENVMFPSLFIESIISMMFPAGLSVVDMRTRIYTN